MAIERKLLNEYMATAFRGPFDKMAEKMSAFLLDTSEADQNKAIAEWKVKQKDIFAKQKEAADARAAELAKKIAGL